MASSISQLQRANLRVQAAQRLYWKALARTRLGSPRGWDRLAKVTLLLDVAKERFVQTARQMR